MLSGIEFGSVIESSRHVTIREGRQTALARNVVIVEFDAVAARDAAVCGDLAWWQQLRNPHLVEIISAARNDEGLTLVVDQAACIAVASVPTPLSRPAQALLVCQTLEALSVIHDAGYAHGDVSVDSLLVDTNGFARLGLPGLHRTTAAFHAPELNGGQRTADGDLYSAGKVLEHVAGRGSDGWAAIIGKATAAAPTERYSSALVMRQAIDAAMTDEEGSDWVAIALSGLAAATTTLLVAGAANTSAGAATGSITVAGITTSSTPPPPPPPGSMPAPVPAAVPPPPLPRLPHRSRRRQARMRYLRHRRLLWCRSNRHESCEPVVGG